LKKAEFEFESGYLFHAVNYSAFAFYDKKCYKLYELFHNPIRYWGAAMQPLSYQADCLEALDGVRKKRCKKALVVMATGLGKTVVMSPEQRAMDYELCNYLGCLILLVFCK
jgi:hypothetical protein